jgi:hypothetical protein
MKADSPAQHRVCEELPDSSGDAVPAVHANDEVRASEANAARSRENILRWTSYLPDDCVRTMIEMGWDITT